MIDSVRVRFTKREIIEFSVFQNSKLPQTANIDCQDGDVKTRYANVENLAFRSTKTFTEMHGSLHSFFNARHRHKAINDDDYPLSHLVESIRAIEELVKCPAKCIVLTVLEFGFNIDLWMNVIDFLTDSVILYKYKAPCEDHKNKKHWKMIKFIYENFIQKLYDKARQYSLHKECIRVETVYMKDIFAGFGILTLEDLCNKDCLVKAFDDYLNRFDHDLLILDSYNGNSNIPDSDREKITEYSHPSFWIKLSKEKNYNRKYAARDELNELIQKYGLNSRKQRLRDMLKEKFYTLIES